jgi:hypothetical protein
MYRLETARNLLHILAVNGGLIVVRCKNDGKVTEGMRKRYHCQEEASGWWNLKSQNLDHCVSVTQTQETYLPSSKPLLIVMKVVWVQRPGTHASVLTDLSYCNAKHHRHSTLTRTTPRAPHPPRSSANMFRPCRPAHCPSLLLQVWKRSLR